MVLVQHLSRNYAIRLGDRLSAAENSLGDKLVRHISRHNGTLNPTAPAGRRWDTVCVVSTMEIHALFLGIPLLLVILLVAMIWSRKGPHPATYKMSESWTHPPILWAATDEVIGHGHGGHGAAEFSVGGGASGKW
jgi:hypothetical protein